MLDEPEVTAAGVDLFRADVLEGLGRELKALPCRWLYDERGCELFEEITLLEEYYPTRTETDILRSHAQDLADFAGDIEVVLEYGAGAGKKTEILLGALSRIRRYAPIDIAGDFIDHTAARLKARFPSIGIIPLIADFSQDFEIPATIPGRRLGFFPGSTIGNLEPESILMFLNRMRRHVGRQGRAVVGVDLQKDVETLLAAYDDARGITAAFNLNILDRINRELDGNFRIEQFEHVARWNPTEAAVEMHIVSLIDQVATIGGRSFAFKSGETIHTESSRKFTAEGFDRLARAAGWATLKTWTDPGRRFALFGLAPLR